METLSTSGSSSPMASITKLCHIIKRADFEGYGFNLHSEKIKPGQFIGKVDQNSPAEAAGLKEGDRIIEVNSVTISNESHKQVVQRIKAISNEVRLFLIDVDYISDDQNVVTNQNNNEEVFSSVTASLPSNQINSELSMQKSTTNSKNEANGMKSNTHDDSLSCPLHITSPNAEASGNIYGLQLSMTAAEMRAKLSSKKKYDPKTDTVDLKKKFEIIQKL